MTGSNTSKEFYERIHKEIKRDAALSHVFNKVWNDPSYTSFFFSHIDELFLRIRENSEPNLPSIDLSMPHLYYATIAPGDSDCMLTILEAAATQSDTKRDIATDSLQQSDLKWIAERIPSIALFFILRFLDKNPHFSALAQKGVSLTLTDVHKFLEHKDFAFEFPDFPNLETEWKAGLKTGKRNAHLETAIPADPVLSELMRKSVKAIVGLFQNIVGSGNSFELAFASVNEARLALMLLHAYKTQHSGITDYDKLLLSLYANKAITNNVTVFLCTRCTDDPFLSISRSKISPQNLRMFCLRCNKPTLSASAYNVHELLLESLQCKDRMLAVATAMLFHEKRISYDAGGYFKNHETDFVAVIQGRKILIECKTFKRFRNVDVFNEVIEDSLKQICEQIRAARSEDTIIDKAILLINQRHDYSEHAKRKAQNCGKEVNVEIEICHPQSFYSLLNVT